MVGNPNGINLKKHEAPKNKLIRLVKRPVGFPPKTLGNMILKPLMSCAMVKL